MKAFVTGGGGFIGQQLIKKLIAQGCSVRVLTRNPSKNFPKDVDVVIGDLVDSSCNLSKALKGCEVVFHCAGEVLDESKMHALHVEGTQRLLKACAITIDADSKPKHWVQLSSVGAYGPAAVAREERVVTEASKTNPKGEYEVTKTLSDEAVVNSVASNLTYTILRPSNVVGFSMTNQSFFSLLSMVKKGLFFFIGSRDTIATYIHVDDVVDALVMCATEDAARNQTFNLSNDCKLSDIISNVSGNRKFLCLPEMPLSLFVKLFSRFMPIPLSQERINALVSKTTYSSNKIQEMLRFKPKMMIPSFAKDYFSR